MTCSPTDDRVGRHLPEKLAALRRGPLPASTSSSDHRVTTFELFFDLAYVFAITQVSALMASRHDALGILQGLTVLALLWWSWTAYSWLSNHARADRGSVRVAMIVAMAAVFVAGLVLGESFDSGRDRFPALVFVGAYLIARLAHLIVYLLAAFEGDRLRFRVVATGLSSLVPSVAMLLAGAVLGSPWQLPCWIAAALYEPLAAAFTGRDVDWRIHSVGHLVERHNLVIILALGESVIAIGTGVSNEPTSPAILLGAVLAVLLCVAMWWAYFSRLAVDAEARLEHERGAARARLATLAYTYLHLVLVAAIVLSAFGVEQAMAHINHPGSFGVFGASVLGLGLSSYLLGTALFARAVLGRWEARRLVGAALLLLSTPLLAQVPPGAALAVAAAAVSIVLAADAWPWRVSAVDALR